jgi:hypothetical protein
VNDAHRTERLDEPERGAVELAEDLVALQEVLTALLGFLFVAPGEEPEILDGRAHEAVVEVDQHGAGCPEDVAVVEVAVDALRLDGRQLRRGGAGDPEGDLLVARPEVLGGRPLFISTSSGSWM